MRVKEVIIVVHHTLPCRINQRIHFYLTQKGRKQILKNEQTLRSKKLEGLWKFHGQDI